MIPCTLRQINKTIASQTPVFDLVRTRRKLACVGPCVSGRKVGIINPGLHLIETMVEAMEADGD